MEGSHEWVKYRFHNGHEPLGEFGERLWSQIILDCGMQYIKFADLPIVNGKGPRVQGGESTLPDFDVSGGGKRRRAYLDSKCKNGPIEYRNAKEWRHGIDKKSWQSYQTVSEFNQQRCFLAIVEIFDDADKPYEWSGTLMMQSLGVLGKPIIGHSNQSHMVYWPWKKFEVVGRYPPGDLWAIANGTAKISEETKSAIEKLFSRSELPIQGRAFA